MSKINYFFLTLSFVISLSGAFFLSARADTLINPRYVASSTNYRLQSDSLNTGGGFSSSAGYGLEDTVGEQATTDSTSTSFLLSSGYQAMPLDTYIAVTSPGPAVLTPALNGGGAGESFASTTWSVITNNPAGYTFAARAGQAPALFSGSNSFADYQPAAAAPDYGWTISASESRFGFVATGEDIVQTFKNNGVSCNTGSGNNNLHCWTGFSLTDQTLARATIANYPTSTDTTVTFRAAIGSTKIQSAGTYQANIIVTAVAE